MSAPLRIAVIGAGLMGRHHANAIRRLSGRAELVAVVDSDPALAAAFGDAVGVAERHTDVSAMLATTRPDVVHICTSPASHAPLARLALEAGAHVYVEKPFAQTSADARAIIALAGARGLRVSAGHQLLFERPTVLAAPIVRQLGAIQHVESYFAFRQARRADGRTPLTAVEQLLDILPHPVYLLVHFLGAADPERSIGAHGLRVDERGSVHAVLSSGEATGVLTVTLHGRPVDSFVRVVGTRGAVTLDYVRGIVIPSLGAGSTIDKILDPYRRAWALAAGSTGSLARRFLKRERSYPGLTEAFADFYDHAQSGTPGLVSPASIERTVALCDEVRAALAASAAAPVTAPATPPTVAVTGGTGLLGRELVTELVAHGETPIVYARRFPPAAERIPGAAYAVADLGGGGFAPPSSVRTVVHCAAETAGSWDAHQRNSIDTTAHVLEGMRAAGIGRLVHVSSLAVLSSRAPQPLSERSPLEGDARRRGPYVWGKLESEVLASNAPASHGVQVRIIRPGALVDYRAFDPPGKLGRALGGLFVAVGPASGTIPVCDVRRAAKVIAWTAMHFDEAPPVVNAVDPVPASRRDLVRRVRESVPGISVLWLPRPLLVFTGWILLAAQKLVRPRSTAVDVASAFDAPRCDTTVVRQVLASAEEAGIALPALGGAPAMARR